ncbi:uncharacterized protein KY384_008941 [Bacidia gigantensis]|uniref:uncharacterized protein n=1 Tax=Bacidia gigantensis TaxID=2732470 RepID=UPI001D04789A|nr:uncharacterized protein KY384_008941 [Bacidia gigantensis]KAG8525297.1 hypothetical protein KY384_008941 [Bacidia gigantensis]
MPPIHVGQTFATLADFKDALREWAIERNWTPHILDSDSHRVRAGCRSSPTCPFRIRANYSAKRKDAKVTTVDDVHNCAPFTGEGPLHQNIKRAETGKLKFLVEAVPKLMNVNVETSIHEIISVVEQKYGQKIPTRQAQKVKGALVTRIKGPCRHCHRLGHTRKLCPQLKDASARSLTFQSSSNLDFSPTGQSDGTYADGGLDDTFGEGETMDYDQGQAPPSHVYSQHPRPTSDPAYQQTSHDGIDPSLGNGIDRAYNNGPIPSPHPPIPAMAAPHIPVRSPRQSYGQSNDMVQQRTPSDRNPRGRIESTMAPNTSSPSRTPGEVRAEASRLMQQATQMMQQVTRMNAEAVRLLNSVGDAT